MFHFSLCIMARVLRTAALSLVLHYAPNLAVAADAAQEPFPLQRALAQALLKNPSLQAFAFESRVAEARRLQAGARANPELGVDVENGLGTGALSGTRSLETTLQLSQLIDLSGTRARRVEVAEEERALAQSDYEAKRLEVLAEVAKRFIEATADAERLANARRARELGEQMVSIVRERVVAAVLPPIELNKARTALARLQIDEEHAEHEFIACRQSLAAVLGEEEPTFGLIRGDLFTLPHVPEFAVLAKALEQSPTLARFPLETKWRDAQLRLAQSLRRSGARISAGVRRVEATDDIGFVAGFSIPLGTRDQQAGQIREARERRNQIDFSSEAMRLEMRTTLFQVYQEMNHARVALTQLQQEVIPQAEETQTLADQGYRAGRYSLIDLLDAQKSVLELRREAVAYAAAFHLHLIEIERLLGAPIGGRGTTP